MNMYDGPSMVAGVDGSEASLLALDSAVSEATLRHWPLRIVHVTKRRREQDEVLIAARARAGAAAPAPLIACDSVVGTPAEALASLAGTAGIVVVGARGLGAIGSFFLGSTSRALVSHAQCPVYVVRGASEDVTGRIVVGIDRHLPAEVVVFAFDEASLRGAELLAVHSWEGRMDLSDTLTRSPAELRQERIAHEESVLTAALAPWGQKYPEVRIRRIVSTDDAVTALEEWAAKADLVVVGRRTLSRRLAPEAGSTVQALLRGKACRVVIVPPA